MKAREAMIPKPRLKHLSKLGSRIVQFFEVRGNHDAARKWRERLLPDIPADPFQPLPKSTWNGGAAR